MHAIKMQENYQPCTHPGCSSGQIHQSGDEQPIMTCIGCFKQTCFTHKRPWHNGRTCAEVDALTVDGLDQTLLTIQRTTKKCPNCNEGIEKKGGCEHMTCMCWYLLSLTKNIPLNPY
jgi:IBR domain, a half RING-finger domain